MQSLWEGKYKNGLSVVAVPNVLFVLWSLSEAALNFLKELHLLK